MEQNTVYAPLFEAMSRLAAQDPIRLHVPGHKGGLNFPHTAEHVYGPLLNVDWTELTGLDNLHDARGVIAEAQALAAEVFFAEETFFLVGGSTVGNVAMILGTIRTGDTVFVQRNSHQSVFNALQMAEARAVFMEPVYSAMFGVPVGVNREHVQELLGRFGTPRAIICTYPNYYGMAGHLAGVIEEAHLYDIPVLVDEAHGAHFGQHQALPSSAMQLGADVSVQSTHKMLSSMTMTSMLHVQGNRVPRHDITAYLHSLQSSSPSYPLLASLDLARAQLQSRRNDEWEEALHTYSHLLRQIEDMGYTVSTPDNVTQVLSTATATTDKPKGISPISVRMDPFKMVIQAPEGMTGYEWSVRWQQAGLYPEMADAWQLLCTWPIHGSIPEKWWSRLENILSSGQRSHRGADTSVASGINVSCGGSNDVFTENKPDRASIRSFLSTSMEAERQQAPVPLAVYRYEDTEQRNLTEAVGSIAAEMITPYPPGVPLVIPGETLTEQNVARIRQAQTAGAQFQGKPPGPWSIIRTLK